MESFNCLNPQTPLEGHHVLEASAGTGKTFAIEHLVVRLLLKGVPLKHILVVTFTRAATRELKLRIRQAIAHALTTLQADTHLLLPYLTIIKKKGKDALSKALFRLEQGYILADEANIFTLHGFCHRMLRDYPFKAGVELSRLNDIEMEGRELMRQHIFDFLRTSLTPDHFSQGQIGTLLKKYMSRIDQLVDKILTLVSAKSTFPLYPSFLSSYTTFCTALETCPAVTKEEFIEIAPFFTKLCDRSSQVKPHFIAQISSLSPTCTKEDFDTLLREKESVLTLLDPANQKKRFQGKLPNKASDFFTLKETLLPIIQSAQNPVHTLIRIAQGCQRLIEKRSYLIGSPSSPDDVLDQMRRSLSSPSFLTSVQRRYNAAIIDEFQDTDPIQWDIFQKLFIDKPIHTLYLVGDPKQSIYSFRDADIYSYLKATELIPYKRYLTTNYRSEPKLLTILNALFAHTPHWLSLPNMPLDCPPVAIPQEAIDTPFPDKKSPVHFLLLDEKKELLSLEKEVLFPYIAAEITFLTEKGSILPKHIALLVKDRYQAARLKQYLETQGIPVLSRGSDSIVTTLSYTLWRTCLQAINHPTKQNAVSTFLAHPLFPLTHHTLLSFLSDAQALFHTLHHLFQHGGFPKMVATLLDYEWMDGKTLEALLLQQGGLEALGDFRHIMTLLLSHSFSTQSSLGDLLHYLDSLLLKECSHPSLKRQPLADSTALSMMTIHASKGLEFDIVFALGLIYPHHTRDELMRSQKKWIPFNKENPTCLALLEERQSESLRKLYVALTRAKKRLYIPVHTNSTSSPQANSKSSPLELFLSKLPPLNEVIPTIGATASTLQKSTFSLTSISKTNSLLQPPQHHLHFNSRPLHSFSSLTQSIHTANAYTPEMEKKNTFPKGTETGLILHALLELAIKEQWFHTSTQDTRAAKIAEFLKGGILAPWEKEITALVEAAFSLPLLDVSLSEIPPSELHAEVEFFFPRKDTLVKGFIDLIFSHRGIYYLLDWKSNALDNYSQSTLKEAMHHHNYFLQAELYSEALKRYLTLKKLPHSIGGAFYLFLRGLPEKQGVYFIPPSPVSRCRQAERMH